jgi:hypothetical protein
VSYDTPNIVKAKAQYVQNKGLAGSMFWELSTDKVGAGSLVGTSHSVYGTLDQTQNHIRCVLVPLIWPRIETDHRSMIATRTASMTISVTTSAWAVALPRLLLLPPPPWQPRPLPRLRRPQPVDLARALASLHGLQAPLTPVARPRHTTITFGPRSG